MQRSYNLYRLKYSIEEQTQRIEICKSLNRETQHRELKKVRERRKRRRKGRLSSVIIDIHNPKLETSVNVQHAGLMR